MFNRIFILIRSNIIIMIMTYTLVIEYYTHGEVNIFRRRDFIVTLDSINQ